jgi:hypothetical protein
MPNEPLALAIRPPDAPDEDEYHTLCAALSQSARGRAFLAEHARRSRHGDSEVLLAAILRIERRLKADAAAAQRLRDDLRMLVSAIRLARPEIDAANPTARAAKLAKLLDLFERRIDAMADGGAAAPVNEVASARMPAVQAEPTRAQLLVLPLPEEPEALQQPEPAPQSAAPSPQAGMIDPAPIEAEEEPAVTEGTQLARAAPATTAAPRPDPLAAIMALSNDERLALFT